MTTITVTDTGGKVHHINPDHIVMVRESGMSSVATIFTTIPTLMVTVDMKRREGADGVDLGRWLNTP